MAIRKQKAPQKIRQAPAETAPEKKPRATARSKKPSKGLDDLIHQCMTDEAFVEALESDPAKALRQNGYPATAPLVRQIKAIDFGVFRRAFLPKPRRLQWC